MLRSQSYITVPLTLKCSFAVKLTRTSVVKEYYVKSNCICDNTSTFYTHCIQYSYTVNKSDTETGDTGTTKLET